MLTPKELELQRTEEYIVKQLPPLVKTFVLNSPKVNKTIEKYERLILSIMNENGTINGKILNTIIEEKYPEIMQWINIPNTSFYLIDEIEKLFMFICKGVK